MSIRLRSVITLFCLFIIGIDLFICGCRKDPELIKPVAELGERDPAFSPDGRFIAYLEEGSGIYLLEIATSHSTWLTYGQLPDWSPDGKWIVYVLARDIYKINVETKEIMQLTAWGNCFFPDWSPNGKRIAFDVSGGDSGGIWLMDTNGTNFKRIMQYVRQPDWSPSGDRLAYLGWVGSSGLGQFTIFIMDSTGDNSMRLTNNEGDDNRPAWSPDDSKIVYVSESEHNYWNIFLINTDGTNNTQLTFEPESDNGYQSCEPAWSPDGSQIVYVRTEWFEDEAIIELVSHLWIMDADGGNRRQLTER
ncbi:MAG: PD40 domain-containing protein [Clostridia bacterium]|nr:PD40 domain-containing protein [Clostridia bacterium]